MKIKTKTKKKLIRFLSLLMIVFSILNLAGIIVGMGNNVYADDESSDFNIKATVQSIGVTAGLGLIMGGIPLIILNVMKLVIIVLGLLLQAFVSGVQLSLDGLDGVGLKSVIFAGAENCSNFLDINFFNFADGNNIIVDFRMAVAKWYYILRLISAAILLVILIYVGIRMAISTIASEQAKYKQMLVDWVTSLALLFLLHYIVIFVVTINSTLVQAIYDVNKDDSVGGLLSSLALAAFHPGLEGFAVSVIYLLFVGEIFSFLLLYMKRMITVGFLIMISPLITITYSIDKIGDGKAQALNAWLKELVYNILIQPFYCVIYVAFFDTMAQVIKENPWGVGGYIFIIIIMKFMKKAEEILRKIFHFEASSMSSISESGQNILNATGKFVSTGVAAGTAFANFKAVGGFKGAKEKLQDFRASEQARKLLKQYYKDDKSGKNGPPSITADTFKDYAESAEGKQKLKAMKQSNLNEINAKAEVNRNKRKEKREQKVKEKAEAQLREEIGDEAYEKLKARADGGDRSAQKIISDKEDKVRQGSFPKRTINGVAKGVSNVAGNVSEGVKRFAGSDYGKLVGAAAKDSIKVATAIGMGAFAIGATGELNDAISLGQAGYGVAKGYLENSGKTLADDSTQKAKKLAQIMGVDPENKEEMQKILNLVYNQGQMGNQLDAKSISNALKDLQDKIANAIGDREDGKRIAGDLIRELQIQMTFDDAKLDIEGLLNTKLNNLIDDDDKKEVESLTKNYAEIFVSSKVYANQTASEKMGIDHLEHDANVVRKVKS